MPHAPDVTCHVLGAGLSVELLNAVSIRLTGLKPEQVCFALSHLSQIVLFTHCKAGSVSVEVCRSRSGRENKKASLISLTVGQRDQDTHSLAVQQAVVLPAARSYSGKDGMDPGALYFC